MAQPVFFKTSPSSTLADIAALTKAQLSDAARDSQIIRGIASLDEAGPMHVTFFDNLKYADKLAASQAGACFVSERFESRVPGHVAVLRTTHPFRAFVHLARALHDDTLRPQASFGTGLAPSAVIHATAQLEDDVIVEPLAVIGPGVEIGSGTLIGSGVVIGPNVRIGRNCDIGPGTTIHAALIGNNVLIHPGCHIGQDGYGFIFDGGRHVKVPQTARVIIQHDVELGAGTTIDRGSLRDTIIGEGTKLDNQVQVGHNVVIGRHCLLAAQIGLAGSLTIGDNVALGAKAGLANHIHVGDGAQLAAMSGVMDDIPAGARYGGAPARPTKQWFRQVLAIEKLGRGELPKKAADSPKENDT